MGKLGFEDGVVAKVGISMSASCLTLSSYGHLSNSFSASYAYVRSWSSVKDPFSFALRYYVIKHVPITCLLRTEDSATFSLRLIGVDCITGIRSPAVQ